MSRAPTELSDEELDAALRRSSGHVWLALQELKQVRPVGSAAREWIEGDGSIGAICDALTALAEQEAIP